MKNLNKLIQFPDFGRVQIRSDAAGDVWVGGSCRTVVSGTIDL